MQLPNTNEPGDDPYALSYPETTRSQIERKRIPEKEIGAVQFNSTCRRTLPFEDKVKVNSLHNLEGMNKAYLLATNRSPEKIRLDRNKNKERGFTPNGMFELPSMTLRDSIEMAKREESVMRGRS